MENSRKICLPRQAKPAAEEASPAAVGKLLYEATCKCSFSQSFFAILIPFSLSSASQARARISLKQFWYLPPEREISYTNQQKPKVPRVSVKAEYFNMKSTTIYILLNYEEPKLANCLIYKAIENASKFYPI